MAFIKAKSINYNIFYHCSFIFIFGLKSNTLIRIRCPDTDLDNGGEMSAGRYLKLSDSDPHPTFHFYSDPRIQIPVGTHIYSDPDPSIYFIRIKVPQSFFVWQILVHTTIKIQRKIFPHITFVAYFNIWSLSSYFILFFIYFFTFNRFDPDLTKWFGSGTAPC